jgi:hypothetical protein
MAPATLVVKPRRPVVSRKEDRQNRHDDERVGYRRP